jgi:hypothetical protein
MPVTSIIYCVIRNEILNDISSDNCESKFIQDHLLLDAYIFKSSKVAENLVVSSMFGDSLVGVGNNNYIFTLAKANIAPNGCDFKPSFGQPSDRYTTGKIIPNIIDITIHNPFLSCLLANGIN